MANPCKNCDRRHQNCWSECEDYKAWKEQTQAAKRALHKGREAENFLMDSISKLKRRK